MSKYIALFIENKATNSMHGLVLPGPYTNEVLDTLFTVIVIRG